MRLFSNQNINFDRFEEDTNIAVWWAFDKTKGWMYRDHFMIPEAAPMAKRFELPEVPKDYGKQTTPDAVAARGGKITRHLKKEKMKVKPIKI